MKKVGPKTALRILITGGVTLALAVVVLGSLAAATRSVYTNRAEPARPKLALPAAVPSLSLVERTDSGDRHTAAADVSVVKLAQTAVTQEWDDDSIVYNGETITYTIIISNPNRTEAITNLLILDILPEDTLYAVHCFEECTQIGVVRTVPITIGGEAGVVTNTRQISWAVPSLAANERITRTFSGQVVCQADGAVFENQAFINYYSGGAPRPGASNQTRTVVRVRPVQGGEAGLSAGPTWCSTDQEYAYDMDWGDFDNDGDLDLALTGDEVVVYRNDEGRLQSFWDRERWAYGLRWADVNGDGRLELVILENEYHYPPSHYRSYIYAQDGSGFSQVGFFTSTYDLFRIAPADYDGDGDLDLATSSWWGECPVHLYDNDGAGAFSLASTCPITNLYFAVRSLAWGDYDSDGDPDLAIGGKPKDTSYPWEVGVGPNRVFENEGGTFGDSVPFDLSLPDVDTYDFYLYDLAWGDYDQDGDLDLAAALPYAGEVRLYSNVYYDSCAPNCFYNLQTITVSQYFRAVDWADMDKDGRLDLLVADEQPTIYRYDTDTWPWGFKPLITLPAGLVGYGSVWRMRGADSDSDGDLDLVISNLAGPSWLFTAFASLLELTILELQTPPPFDASPASSVAWGDADGDGSLDLLFGAGASAIRSTLYYNQQGAFSESDVELFLGFGPRSVAFGDMDADGDLDVAFGTPAENQVYRNDGGGNFSLAWESTGDSMNTTSVAWGDWDGDFDLDLAVGNSGQANQVYRNEGGGDFSLAWESTGDLMNTTSIAWGDWDGDRDLDLAVGNRGQADQVYQNHGGTLSLTWTSSHTRETRSLAWGDYDSDGDIDLAVGNYDWANHIYENQDGSLGATPVWTSTINGTPTLSRTTSLAWGDWDNDGDLDLAVGNEGQHDLVYVNLGSTAGLPQLFLRWVSAETLQTSGVAWGDPDGDGDLELAVSQDGNARNGVYENNYVSPVHLYDDFAAAMPLPNNMSYLWVERPGSTDDAYFFSSPEVLSGPINPTVEIRYRLFDPDGTRDEQMINAPGDRLLDTLYQFSLDGGGTWHDATPAAGWTGAVLTTSRLGQEATFLWDAQQDEAISDDARFRITIIPHYTAGLIQRASVSAISPPFRVRGLSCEWPTEPSIYFSPDNPAPNQPVEFRGSVATGSGVLTFDWDFGDASTGTGQLVQHIYAASNTYVVTLTVSGEPCPITEPAIVTATVVVGSGVPEKLLYLPLIFKSSSDGTAVSALGRPAQVTGLSGSSQPGAGTTRLAWQPNAAAQALSGYRIYRRSRTTEGAFQLWATLPADVTTYTDHTTACGYAYYVTAFNAAGESLPSTASYFSLPCQD